ncbi:MAG: glycosyltransferase family 4 protein [Burkholderiales bacterium]
MRDTAQGAPPLRVLVVIGNADTGGMETCVDSLVRPAPDGIAFSVAAPFASAVTERWRADGIPVHVVPQDDERGLAASVQRAVEVTRRTRPALLHAHLPNANTIASLAGAICGVPVLATLHGRALTQRDAEVLHAGSAHALVVCEAALSHALLLGLAPSRVTLVRNGVDTARFAPGPARHASPVIGFVGRLSPEKAPEDFVRVCAYVGARVADARFRVIGDGPLRQRCEDLARDAGIAERIAFAGLQEAMPAQYHALDLVVCTSHTEGAPYAVLEAMASGVPVVATDAGGLPEIVVNAVTGRVLPVGAVEVMGRAVCEILAQPARLARMRVAARARVLAAFDVREQRRATYALMRRLAARGAGEEVSRTASADR